MYFSREWRKYTGAESSKCAFRVATALWYVPLGVVASAQQGIPTHIDLLAEALGVGGEGAVEVVKEPFGGSVGGGEGGDDHTQEDGGAVEEHHQRIGKHRCLLSCK